jgi:hypothetical protein
MAGEQATFMEDDFAMRKLCFVLFVSAIVSLFGESRTAIAEATESEPDFKLAYVLATAAYCAYAVGELDDDHGRARAFECLRDAADKDPVHLERLKVASTDDVEAYVNPQSPKDAYLLIREKNGVIRAFRGTLVPPISPSSGRFAKATAEAVKAYKEQAAAALGTFSLDWFNNAQGKSNSLGRHSGFDQSWQGLRSHLSTDCNASSATGAEEEGAASFDPSSKHLRAAPPINGSLLPDTVRVAPSPRWQPSTFQP